MFCLDRKNMLLHTMNTPIQGGEITWLETIVLQFQVHKLL